MVKLDKSKYSTCLKILAIEIGQEMKKEEARDQGLRLEIVKGMADNKFESAKLKCGEIVRIRNRLGVYDILKIYVEQLAYDIPILERSDKCPEQLISNIHTIIFASKMYAIKHLLNLADLLKSTYGGKFYDEAQAYESSKADREMKDKIMFHSPTAQQLDEVMEEIKQYAMERNQKITQYDSMMKQNKQNVETPSIPGPNDNKPGSNDPPADDLESLKRRLANL